MRGEEASRGTNKLQTNIKILNRCLNFAFRSKEKRRRTITHRCRRESSFAFVRD